MVYHFTGEAAAVVGVPAAVLLQHFAFWTQQNAAARRNLRDGRAWTYQSLDALAERFPFLTKRALRTALAKLKAAGLIVVGDYNRDSMNHTTWYALTAKGQALCEPPGDTQKRPIDATEATHRADVVDLSTIDTDEKLTDQEQLPAAREREAQTEETVETDGPAPAADDDAFSEALGLFSSNIHPITGAIERQALHALYQDYGKDWTLAAIAEAAEHHGQSVRYLDAILARWRREGFRTTKKGAHTYGYRTANHSPSRDGGSGDDSSKWEHETSGWG